MQNASITVTADKDGNVTTTHPRKLNVKQTLAAIRALGMRVGRTGHGNEYRVSYFWLSDESSAYYTDDSQDALDTARTMAAARPSQTRPIVNASQR